MVFHKTPTSVIGPEDTIIRPKEVERLDAEGELVAIIKDTCKNVSKADALNHVFGYTCGNDVSARDWQRRDRNDNNSDWWRAKSADTFSPMGPWIETDLDPHAQHLRTRVNGSEEQNESTAHLIFDVPTMIEFISRYVTLDAGDCIYTGTPGTTSNMDGRRRLRNRHQRHRHPPQHRKAGGLVLQSTKGTKVHEGKAKSFVLLRDPSWITPLLRNGPRNNPKANHGVNHHQDQHRQLAPQCQPSIAVNSPGP